jgi:hypothetical protein
VAAPVTDTVLAAASAVLAIAVLATTNSGCSSGGQIGCNIGQGTGEVVAVAGAAFAVLFGVSAGVGYARTSACRTSLEPGFVPPPSSPAPPPQTSLWPPPRGLLCLSVETDAPRACPAAPSPAASSALTSR